MNSYFNFDDIIFYEVNKIFQKYFKSSLPFYYKGNDGKYDEFYCRFRDLA